MIADKRGPIGSSTSDSERAMITENTAEVLMLIYSFSDNKDLEKALESGKEYIRTYTSAAEIEAWIVE